MADKTNHNSTEDNTQFRTNRVNAIKEMYADEPSERRRQNQTQRSATSFENAAAVRDALKRAVQDRESIVEASRQLYATNPIYSSVINYLSDMFMWRYKVTPHKTFKKSKSKIQKEAKTDDFRLLYYHMLEVVDGLSIETKFPAMLTYLFTQGAVYFTTFCDEDSITIDTILLPDKYCRKIGETQYGTAIIQFDFSYFQDQGLTKEKLNDLFKTFPKEFQKGYNAYLKDMANKRWGTLDPRFSTGIMLNEFSIPTYFYILGGILDYEQYQDNELERNENMLKYLVVQTMPTFQDKLLFENDEVKELHRSVKKVVDKNNKSHLITTYGNVNLLKVAENDTSENQVLSKAFKAIFNNAGFNSSIFLADSVEALKTSLIRDKGIVWKYVLALMNFYTIAINNWFDFKDYQADIDILPISSYTYNDDIKRYKDNATLGVGKLDYIIATGIKQKNVEDNLKLESFLKLDQITPMQTSYTQTDKAREQNGEEKSNDLSSNVDIEPSNEKDKSPDDSSDKKPDED